MKVSFGRIIPINSISAPDYNSKKKRVDNSTYNVAKVLNSEKTSAYSKNSSTHQTFFISDLPPERTSRCPQVFRLS